MNSMFNQYAKWLAVSRNVRWRQDRNGFTHQERGFFDLVMNKKADSVRVYLPPDANTLRSVADHCLRSRHSVNVIIAGKQPELQWLDMDAAIAHCTAGLGICQWAGNDEGHDPHEVMAEDSCRQRCGPDDAPAANGASAWTERRGVRRAVHASQADRARSSRLPVVDPSVDVSAHQPREAARTRIQDYIRQFGQDMPEIRDWVWHAR